MKKTQLLILLLLTVGLTACNSRPANNSASASKPSSNSISVKQCALKNGTVFNTLNGKPNGKVIAKVVGLRCPCVCVLKNKPDNTLWVKRNGSLVKFSGNLNDIKTFNDCKNAGFPITDDIPTTCTVGKPDMTGGRYKTFVNNPIASGKVCTDYHYSNCPANCVAKCKSSSCSKPDKFGSVACTSDCDGKGSCIAR